MSAKPRILLFQLHIENNSNAVQLFVHYSNLLYDSFSAAIE